MKLERIFLFTLLSIVAVPAAANSDGELAWTNLRFCNGAGYCVDISTADGEEIESLQVTRKGVLVEIPSSMYTGVGEPLLNTTRFISTRRDDGGYENVLELTFVIFEKGESRRALRRIHIFEGKAYKLELISPPAPG